MKPATITKIFLLALISTLFLPSALGAEESEIVSIPLLGDFDATNTSKLLMTVLIAGADGFNPCSIWMLLFLLGMVIHTGSRKQIAIVGTTFLTVTAIIYGLFISGIIAVMSILSHITWITYFVAVLALIFGAVNVKDFFFYKKGLSFSIPDKYKPQIFKDSRVAVKQKSTFKTILLTATLAAGIAIIELPCTAGLPLIWSGLISNAQTSLPYSIYLITYLLTYLFIEIAILIVTLITLKSFKMTEFKGRSLKLIGGLLIMALAGVLLIDQSIMYSIPGVLGLIFSTIMLSLIIIFISKKLENKEKNKTDLKKGASKNEEKETKSEKSNKKTTKTKKGRKRKAKK